MLPALCLSPLGGSLVPAAHLKGSSRHLHGRDRREKATQDKILSCWLMPNQLLLQIDEHCVPRHVKPGVMGGWKEQILLNLLYWAPLGCAGAERGAVPSSPQVNLPFHIAHKLLHSQLREV